MHLPQPPGRRCQSPSTSGSRVKKSVGGEEKKNPVEVGGAWDVQSSGGLYGGEGPEPISAAAWEPKVVLKLRRPRERSGFLSGLCEFEAIWGDRGAGGLRGSSETSCFFLSISGKPLCPSVAAAVGEAGGSLQSSVKTT